MLNKGAIYWAAALGVGVAAGAGAAAWRYGDPLLQSLSPAPLVGVAPVPSSNPAPAAPSAPKRGGAGADAAPQAASKTGPKAAEPPPPEQAAPPQFDIVRVEPTGDAVIAGRAAPNAKVSVTDHGRIVAEATADDSGEFTVLPPAFTPGGHSLGLTESVGGGKSIDSSTQVSVDVPQPAVKATAGPKMASQSESPKPDSNAPAQPVGGGAQTIPSAPAPSGPSTINAKAPAVVSPLAAPASTVVAKNEAVVPKAPAPAAVVAKNEAPAATAMAPTAPGSSPIVVAKNEAPAAAPASKTLTPPAAPAATALAKNEASAPIASGPAPRVVIGSVAAEEGGRLAATGSAAPNALLRLYLNGTFVANVTTGSDGRWSLTVERGMTGGAYAVRADQVDPVKGSVVARAEVPFNYPDRLAAAQAPAPVVNTLKPPAPIAAPPKPSPTVAEPAPSAAISSSPKPSAVMTTPSADAPTAPSAPIATPPNAPVMAAEKPVEAPAAPAAAPPKPSGATSQPQQSASAETPAASQPEAAPAAPVVAPPKPSGATSQPRQSASAETPPSGPAAAPQSPAGAPPEAAAAAPAPADAANAVVHYVDTKKVVRGDSLWRISSDFYGNGLRYKQIYEANASQIRDPWLIYPGQIFVLPRETPF